MIFCLGLLFHAIASFVFGVILIKRNLAKYWNLFIPFFGVIGLFSFGFEILLIPYGVSWIIIGYPLIFEHMENQTGKFIGGKGSYKSS